MSSELNVHSIKLVPDVDVNIVVFCVLRTAPTGLPISPNRGRYSTVSSMGTRALTLVMYHITIGTPPCSSSNHIFLMRVMTSMWRRV